jgi:arylsulfatase A-like enzyme
VLFVADTFRADNLACYGGLEGLTPELDRLASESLTFLQARSTSTYTLPAHAALFSSLYPHQTSADGLAHALPDAIDTIAERLRRSGYRTGAVTDAAVVSRAFGMQQGFESWDERRSDLDSTLERVRAFLGSADGRPTFLFVHTLPRALGLPRDACDARAARPRARDRHHGDWDSCYGPFEAIGRRDRHAGRGAPVPPAAARSLPSGVADLDLWFGHFREDPLVAPLLGARLPRLHE